MKMHQTESGLSQGVNPKKLMLGLQKNIAGVICNKIKYFYLLLDFHTVLFSLLTNHNENACVPSVFLCCEFCCIWPWCL